MTYKECFYRNNGEDCEPCAVRLKTIREFVAEVERRAIQPGARRDFCAAMRELLAEMEGAGK